MTLLLRDRLATELRYALAAIQFLTRLPVPDLRGFEPQWLGRGAAYFPLAGLLVGLISAAVLSLSSMLWPYPVPAVLAVLASILVTGAFHEDGLADTADGLGATGDHDRCLEIMRDSRVGTYGAVALLGSLFARIAALNVLAAPDAAMALIAAHTSARAVPVVATWLLPYANGAPRGRIGAMEGATARRRMFAVAFAAVSLLILPLANALAGVAIGCIAAGLLLQRSERVLGGVTGDILGAAEQLFEIAILLGAAASFGASP